LKNPISEHPLSHKVATLSNMFWTGTEYPWWIGRWGKRLWRKRGTQGHRIFVPATVGLC